MSESTQLYIELKALFDSDFTESEVYLSTFFKSASNLDKKLLLICSHKAFIC
ncbi:hypothetical protein JOB18_006788, partial [Solea senegalensis]